MLLDKSNLQENKWSESYKTILGSWHSATVLFFLKTSAKNEEVMSKPAYKTEMPGADFSVWIWLMLPKSINNKLVWLYEQLSTEIYRV